MSSTPYQTSVSPITVQDVTAQDAITISAITSSTPYGFASKADGDEMLALLEALRAQQNLIISALIEKGIVK